MSLSRAYYTGMQCALEKCGVSFESAGQAAQQATSKAFNVKFTKSVDNPAGLVTRNTGNLLSSRTRATPKQVDITQTSPTKVST